MSPTEADEVQALDLRRQKQITNQGATINRLLDGSTYEGELQALHEQLAKAQAELAQLGAQLRLTPGHELQGAACSCGGWTAQLGSSIQRGFDQHLLDVR